jgi:glyoxylase-like metal-dependent hydrolase (beta-lactamase superfamily II)
MRLIHHARFAHLRIASRNVLAVGLLLIITASFTHADDPRLRIEKIADGVYAALQPAALRFEDSNSTIILLDDGALVVDTQTSPVTSAAIISEIRKLTDKPVRYVVNTHWHGDHVQGNSAYRDAFPDVLFIAHRNTRKDMPRAQADLKEELENLPKQIDAAEKQLAGGLTRSGQPLTDAQKASLSAAIQRYKGYLKDRREVKEFVLPTLTFEDTLTLHRGDREIRLLHFPGHTRGDVVVFLPREKVLVTGDLLDDLPYTGHGSPAALVKTLHALDQLEWDTLVPGHGSVRKGQGARDHLHLIASVFESIVSQVADAVRASLSVEDTLKKVDLDRFREPVTQNDPVAQRYWGFFMSEGVKRAYQEATGTVKD